MKWMRERDLLIAQTMAFVQSVTGKKPEAEKTVATSIVATSTVATSIAMIRVETPGSADAATPLPDIETLMAETLPVESPKEASGEASKEALRPAQTIARLDLRNGFHSEISEIKARVANFRAHQERFSQEREAYCSATMAKVHATLRGMPGSPRVDK
jgi:hypothetical protein